MYVLAIAIGTILNATIFGQVRAARPRRRRVRRCASTDPCGAQVTQLITTMEQGKILYETTVQSVFDRMRYHNVPSALQERVGMFYKARARAPARPARAALRQHARAQGLWERHHVAPGDESASFTKSLSEPLRMEVNLFLNRDMVESVPMFQKWCAPPPRALACAALTRSSVCSEKNVILSIISVLNHEFYLPGDYVVRAGEFGDKMFFVRRGK